MLFLFQIFYFQSPSYFWRRLKFSKWILAWEKCQFEILYQGQGKQKGETLPSENLDALFI